MNNKHKHNRALADALILLGLPVMYVAYAAWWMAIVRGL